MRGGLRRARQGNCIGVRNARFFLAFLAATASLQALGVLYGACPAPPHPRLPVT